MSNIEEEINNYKEKVLQMQFEISELITHSLTKGEVREDFIKKTIKNNIIDIQLLKGIVIAEEYQSPQTDLIIPLKSAILNKMGEHCIIDVNDVKFMFEIKSNLTINHIKKMNKTLKIIKEKNANIKGGIICYKIDCLEKNILKKFGYYYDDELDFYAKQSDDFILEFENIDYIISFDPNKEFILSKNITGDFVLNKKVPIIKDFLRIFKNSEVSSQNE